ncbi:MAG TPA: MucB/RseB C-terminal domain-containing protein [Gallionellaceae bacterium]
MVKQILIAMLALGAMQAAYSDPAMQEDLKWLETMAFAAHKTDYSGTFVYQFGSHVEVSRITHVTDASGEYGRLESLDGARREIIRHNSDVWGYVGENKVKIEGHHSEKEFPAMLPEGPSLSKININYQVSQAGEARVAGFNTHAVLFLPKDNLRYARRMWVDSNSGLLLKSEVIDERGAVVEQYAFTQLTMDSNIDRSWIAADKAEQSKPITASVVRQKRNVGGNHHDAAGKAVPAPASGWQVDAMPEGFGKIAELRRPMHNRASSAIQMVYSDGLASISVFIEENDNDDDDHSGLTSQGAIQVYSRLLDGHLVTVVGEVPPQTVIQVGDSVRFAGN